MSLGLEAMSWQHTVPAHELAIRYGLAFSLLFEELFVYGRSEGSHCGLCWISLYEIHLGNYERSEGNPRTTVLNDCV